MYAETNKWIPKIINRCFKKPGQHIIIGGTTGTGKTQTIFHIIKQMRKISPDEYILVMDIGKSSEVLRLADFGKLIFFIPALANLEIEYASKYMEEKYSGLIEPPIEFNTYEHLFSMLRKDAINVVCIKPYHKKADTYAKEIVKFFDTLIELASNKTLKIKGKLPLSVVIDEMHWVAPGLGSALNDEHTEAGKGVQMNIDTLRSMRVRIIGATQNWTKLRKGVRDAFSWIWIRRGLSFSATDEPRLSRYNIKWEQISDNEVIVAFPKRDYSDPIELPYYGEGEDIGDIYYINPPTSLSDRTEGQEVSTPLHA